MKKLITITLLIFLVQNSVSQTLEQNIQEIRTQFKWINSQKDFTKINKVQKGRIDEQQNITK